MKSRRIAVAVALIAALAVAVCASAFGQTAPNSEIRLKLQNIPIADAVKQLLGQGYVIESGVTGTVSYVNISAPDKETALRTLLRSVGLTFKKDENGTYIISAKSSQPTDVAPPPPVDAGAAGDPELPPAVKKIDKIKLDYADSADIAAILGGESISARTNPMGGGGMGGFGGMGGGMGGGFGGMGGGGYGGGGGFGGGGFGSYGGSSYGGGGGFGGGGNIGGGYGGYRGGGY